MSNRRSQYRQVTKQTKKNNKRENRQANKLSKRLERKDFKLFIVLLLLCTMGIIMLYSASSYICSISEEYNYQSTYLFKRQIIFLVVGAIALIIIRQVLNYNYLTAPIAGISFGAMIILVGALKIAGHVVKGAKRWILIGGFSFQPAEIIKILMILFLAIMVPKLKKALETPSTLFVFWFIALFPVGLLFIVSNDLSSCAVIAGMVFFVTFVCTDNKKIHFIVMCIGVFISLLVVMYAIHSAGEGNFRLARINAWLSPEKYIKHEGYQIMQGLYAIGSGGLFGKGLGNSYQKLGPIPEAHNDMIFSIICEELGIFGAGLIIILFIYLLYYIGRIAYESKNLMGSIIALSVFLHIGLQVIINISVNTNTIPNTGIALPFISYGGTALFCLMVEMGMVYAVERNNRIEDARIIIKNTDEENLDNYLE